MKSHIYRVGDQVEIVNPRWIRRVGYPLHWHDVIDEVAAWPEFTEAVKALGWKENRVPFYFQQAVAKLHVEKNKFGGNTRSIIYEKVASEADNLLDLLISQSVPAHGYVGRVVEVLGKRLAYTGVRIPQRSGTSWTADGPDDWYEPGGLEDRKCHVILRTVYGEIEACDVKLVTKGLS